MAVLGVVWLRGCAFLVLRSEVEGGEMDNRVGERDRPFDGKFMLLYMDRSPEGRL